MLVRVNQLQKTLNGKNVINDISFTLKPGTINAILGPNGVGKTMTVRLLTGLLQPTHGEIEVFGVKTTDPHFERVRKQMGVQNDGNLYENLTVYENLKIWARFYDVPKVVMDDRIDALLTYFELIERKKSKVGTLSKGLKQKVAIMRALIHHPKLLILDEPTSGLDPSASESLNTYLQQQVREEEMTVFMCTHHLQGLEQIADHIFMMDEGRFIASGRAEDLLREAWPQVEFDIHVSDVTRALALLENEQAFVAQENSDKEGYLRVKVEAYDNISQVIKLFTAHQLDVYTVTEVQHTIKELYFKKMDVVQHD
ncbi:ABC transporter ATP-binding protein [Staphylococcus delphini]|uniref:ABC transporter ATP-binding protein n=1 Tax=Staphylococcus delphini TaxID=53344 RepID=UPI0012D33F67|nr:ABC transporter ATP-binding protein [Staphylococcus delphini]MTV23611.1 ATP-binding cassette domain-containing protein [Staphylococcus delphini]